MPVQSSLSGAGSVRAESTQSDGKSFEQLRSECLRKGVLFEDPDFPAADSSLFYSQSVPVTFQWKRPKVSSRKLDAVIRTFRRLRNKELKQNQNSIEVFVRVRLQNQFFQTLCKQQRALSSTPSLPRFAGFLQPLCCRALCSEVAGSSPPAASLPVRPVWSTLLRGAFPAPWMLRLPVFGVRLINLRGM